MSSTDNADEASAKRDEAFLAQGLDPKTGFATDGDWPINARLRAEAMAKAGVTSDPAGIVADDVIAGTKDRLDAEERERIAAERAAPSVKWSREKLVDAATSANLTVTDDMDKAAIVAAIEAAPAAPQG